MATKKVIEAEAKVLSISFEFNDETFQVPRPNLWPVDAVEAFEQGKVMTFVRHLFGEDEYVRIKSVCHTIEDVTSFMTTAMKAAGHDPKG